MDSPANMSGNMGLAQHMIQIVSSLSDIKKAYETVQSENEKLREEVAALREVNQRLEGMRGSGNASQYVKSNAEDTFSNHGRREDLELLLEGTWAGHYFYQGGATDDESRFNMLACRINQEEIYMAGSGKDSGGGNFTIYGTVRRNNEVSFRKNYHHHGWNYTGTLKWEEGTMTGTWDGGNFRFNRISGDVEQFN